MSLLISPLQRSQKPPGGAAAEIGGLFIFAAGAKPFSPRRTEKSPELFCEWAVLGMNPGLSSSCLPSGVFSFCLLCADLRSEIEKRF